MRVSYIVILAILDQNLFLILAILITIRILSKYQNSKLALAATLALMLILAHFGSRYLLNKRTQGQKFFFW